MSKYKHTFDIFLLYSCLEEPNRIVQRRIGGSVDVCQQYYCNSKCNCTTVTDRVTHIRCPKNDKFNTARSILKPTFFSNLASPGQQVGQ